MKDETKQKIELFFAGIVTGILAFLGITTLSRRYRGVKREVESAKCAIQSADSELRIAQELQSISDTECRKVEARINRCNELVRTVETTVREDEAIITDSEYRLAECRELIEDCQAILAGEHVSSCF